MPHKIFTIGLVCCVVVLTSCTQSSNKFNQTPIPKPLRDPVTGIEQPDPIPAANQSSPTPERKPLITIIPPDQASSNIVETTGAELKLPNFKTQSAVSINVESLPLPAFINELFGNVLGLSFQIETVLQNKKDLVTLRITEAQPPKELYQTALQVLADYGVVVEVVSDKLIKFSVDDQKVSTEPPLLISGRALPEVPVSHRPVFQSVALKVMRANQVGSLLNNILRDKELNVAPELLTNTLLISGPFDKVKFALEVIEFFDRPSVRTQNAMRINPAFLSVEDMAKQLEGVLKTEGYYAGIGDNALNSSSSVIFLPLKTTNTLLAFAADNDVLLHIKKWVQQLDVAPPSKGGPSVGLYFYPVKNTSAETLAKTFAPLLSNLQNDAPANQPAAAIVANLENSLVVDSLNNVLIYQGKPHIWGRLLPLLRQLDKPSRQVLIEMVIAEVTLSDEERSGVEWLVNGLDIGSLEGTLRTLGGLGLNASGLNYSFVNSLGQTRAILNAFASSSRVNLLSSPRLMVKSGETASINIGSEVPVVTSQSTDPAAGQIGGNSALLQQIQYRRTGVNLEVKPIVYASNRVDIEISQEVSQAEENTTSNISSPVILNRSINTNLSLSDGGSVLLGGLMTSTLNKGWSGVPVLSEVPFLGNLFKTERQLTSRTELMILIVPYVLGTDEEVEEITNLFRSRLSLE